MKNFNKILLISFYSLFSTFQLYSTPINQFINSVSPPMNANSVVKSSDIVITFEQTMNGSTMTDANVKVFGYQTGLMNVSLDFNSVANTLSINPVNEFKNGEKISITLTTGIKTLTNQNISPFLYSFRTKALGGTGTFIKAFEINNIANGCFSSGDFDGDGDIDLLLNDKIFKNNGTGLFLYYSTLNINGISLTADFDNDGDLDIIITSNNLNHFFRNNGFGDFFQEFSFPGGVDNYGDFDGNGFLDLTYFSDINANLIHAIKNTAGSFSNDTVYNITNLAICNPGINNFKKILIEDMDNNGSPDLIVCNSNSSGNIFNYIYCENFIQLNNSGDGIFNSQFIYSHDINDINYFILDSGDPKLFSITNNGNIDILTQEVFLKNVGNGVYSNEQGIGIFGSSIDADFNGDSNIDMLTYYSFVTPLTLFLNDGAGNFSFSYPGDFSLYNTSYTSSDFDNDGDIDIAIKESGNDKVAILLNGDSPLPVELTSFTSDVNSNSVKLNWSTSAEQNNSGFEIQRTFVKNETPDVWTKAGFIIGAGNSNSSSEYSFEDKNLSSGKYKFRLKQIDFNGNFKYYDLSVEVLIGIPASTELMQNYPNPFNPVTNISYRLSENGNVSISVYDNSGREVKTLVNEFKEAGYYSAEFIGSDLASGIYFYKLTAGNFVMTKKLSLVK
ncbi:MAG TPA: FG-GAP-like repeat-containing protein [Ignavibacteria bacterium]|nr:FG-GAP-like repeat-containing protein [Ignavibacteria bacterium]